MVHPDSSANHFLNDLISTVDQRSYNGDLKLKLTEVHLKRLIAIQRRAFDTFL